MKYLFIWLDDDGYTQAATTNADQLEVALERLQSKLDWSNNDSLVAVVEMTDDSNWAEVYDDDQSFVEVKNLDEESPTGEPESEEQSANDEVEEG